MVQKNLRVSFQKLKMKKNPILKRVEMSKLKKVELTPAEKWKSLQKSVGKKQRKNKFNNDSCRCNHKHIHKSRFEARVCNDLHFEYNQEIKSGTCEINTEYKFEFIVSGVKIAIHYMDFLLTFKGGRRLAVEAKGFETDVWKMKSKLFKALFPEIEYEIRYRKKP